MSDSRSIAVLIEDDEDEEMKAIYENDIEEELVDDSGEEIVIFDEVHEVPVTCLEMNTNSNETVLEEIKSKVDSSSGEEAHFDSSDTDSELFEIAEIKSSYKRMLTYQVAKERNRELMKEFDYLQGTIMLQDPPVKPRWRRIRLLKKGLLICNELTKEEIELRVREEELLQKNWRLRKRLDRLQRMKKRKSGNPVNRRASGPITGTPKCVSPEKKRFSLDEKNVAISDPSKVEIKKSEENDTKQELKKPTRNSKKQTGLTDEEKEFYELEERIEDLLLEVDTLWNEIKDDEEIDEKEEIDLSVTETAEKPQVSPPKKALPTIIPKNVRVIKVKNISKLMEQRGINQSEIIPIQTISSPNILTWTQNNPNAMTKKVLLGKKHIEIKENVTPNTSKHERKQTLNVPSNSSQVITISDGSDSESSDVIVLE